MGVKKIISVSLAATLATTVFLAKPKLSFNKMLEENIVMAAPVQVPLNDQKKIAEDAKACAGFLKSYINKGNATEFTKFVTLWNKYNKNIPQSDPKGNLFWNLFAGSGGKAGEYKTQIKNDPVAGKIESVFSKEYLKKNPQGYDPLEFANAIHFTYSKFLSGDLIAATASTKFGADFVSLAKKTYLAAHPEKLKTAPADLVPVRVPVPMHVNNKTLDVFLEFFGVKDILAKSSKQEKMRGLVATMIGHYNFTTFKEAGDMASALLHSYDKISKSEQSMFLKWLKQLDSKERKTLGAQIKSIAGARGSALPYTTLKIEFDKWMGSRFATATKIRQLEIQLLKFPKSITKTNLWHLSKSFEKTPKDYTLEKFQMRMLFLRKKETILNYKKTSKSKANLKKVEREILDLNKWLKKLGITEKTPELGLSKLHRRIKSLQISYYTINKNNLRLATAIEESSINKTLFSIYRKYISAIDSRSLNLLKDVKPNDPKYASKIRQKVEALMLNKDVESGRAQWISDYVPLVAPTRTASGDSPTEAKMYALAANLDPAAAIAFTYYLKTIKSSGLSTEAEKKLIVSTVAKLYLLHPLLVTKYFNAINHIADICENNQSAFINAMMVISARIDAETDPLLSRTSPAQMLPMNARKVLERLDRSLGEIALISKGSIAQFDRLNLLDERLYIRPNPPHVIEQKPPGYAQNLLVGEEGVGRYFTPYPFPYTILTPAYGSIFSGGSVFSSQPTYDGGITLPQFRPLQVYSSAGAVGSSMHSYLWPTHPVVSLSKYLPGVNIPAMSSTKLLNEIQRAFVPTERPEYIGTPIGGGLAAGVIGRKTADEWEIGGGGLGSLLTPTGGYAIGGAAEPTRVFGGASVLAVPIGKIKGTELSLDGSVTGVEKFDDNAMKIIQRTITTQWNPKNPSQMLVVVNSDRTNEDKWYTTARSLYIDKKGTIYDLKGGQNDLVPTLNFLAGYGNKNFNTPSTVAGNYEWKVKKGGGALVFDLGKTPLLFHAQSLPFFVPEGKPQPLLVQWTAAAATTTEKGKRTRIYQLALPGKMLHLENATDKTKKDKYTVQDIDFMLRNIKEKKVWELRLGGAYARTPLGNQGKAGIFIKTQTPKTRLGGGAYYEAGATNLKAIALLNQVQSAQVYIKSLHRVAWTVYGSKEMASKITAGGLVHMVHQLKENKESGMSYDQTFYRTVGLLKGLKSAARIDLSRISGLDQMLTEYEEMGAQVGQNPQSATNLIKNFQNKYSRTLSQVFDKYFLGIQINKNFSLEASIVTKEEENKWTKQAPESVYVRTLVSWKSGFARAFVSMPLAIPAASGTGSQMMGLAGAGVGFDLFDSIFLQRATMDAGAILARMETGANSTEIRKWSGEGFFAQGALSLFSNVLEDSKSYRRLVEKHERYKLLIRSGLFSKIPSSVRERMCKFLDPKIFPPEVIKRIRVGKDLKTSSIQTSALEDSMWREWFYDQKFTLEQKFNGNMRVLLGGSGYHFLDDKTYWDVGAFVEYVDKLKAYVIVAKRDQIGVFAGADLKTRSIRMGIMGGITGAGMGGAASIGYQFSKARIPMEFGVSGFGRSSQMPDYTAPMYFQAPRSYTPEFGVIFYFIVGGAGSLNLTPAKPTMRGNKSIPGTSGRY